LSDTGIEAGWYPDPKDQSQIRYWDGQAWTEHIASKDKQSNATQGNDNQQNSHLDEFFVNTDIVIASTSTKKFGLSGKARQTIFENSSSGIAPWFVLASGTDGVLAAYEKELVIVKVGALTGLLSSATGGGRITHIPYRQIVSIEYNGGFMMGVLEVLTASYDGGMNKDFWGVKSLNSSGGDPRQQNNTLPIPKDTFKQITPQLNRIRELVEASHTVRVEGGLAPTPQNPAPSVSDELIKLSELHKSGVLSDEEFQQAKARLLEKM
jgi:hypothetical protein